MIKIQINISIGDKRAIIHTEDPESFTEQDILKLINSIRAEILIFLINEKKVRVRYPFTTLVWDGKKYIEV